MTDGVRDSWEFEMTEFMIKTLGIEYWSNFRKKKRTERKKTKPRLTHADKSTIFFII